MNDDQLLRYSRHILLDGVGVEGQAALLNARAIVVGAGGLGSAALLYLAGAGVGCVHVVDHDAIDLTNLQRQIAHTTQRIGEPKAASAVTAMLAINPEIHAVAHVQKADAALLDQLLPGASVVLDCSDNFATRHLLNAACVKHKVPLVIGAALQWDAQLMVVDPRQKDCACYACVFENDPAFADAACATLGVLAPLVGMVGSLQAAEAIKLICQLPSPLTSGLLMLDARTLETQCLQVARRADCAICSDIARQSKTGELAPAPAGG